jgi:POT family proton-dependent oligopeptide transporter
MAHTKYLTAPDHRATGWPKGVPYIIGNEGCERFSYYGMRSILQVHLTSLYVAEMARAAAADKVADNAATAVLAAEHAQEVVHLFFAGVYAFPMIGAIIADRLLGKYRTILWLSWVYCLGHLVLSIAENTLTGMFVGLALVAIGSGGIKPCVSANVGDQFGQGNWHLVEKVFQAFYFIINFGSFFATLAIPAIRAWEVKHLDWSIHIGDHEFKTSLAFALPGVLMLIATVFFWAGRKVFVHVPPNPGGRLGLIDTVSSTLLFMGFIGMPMFFWNWPTPWAFWLIVAVSIAAGLFLFAIRQHQQQDDGFLAVLLYSVMAWFRGENSQARRAVPGAVPADSIQRHWLYAGAAKRFGELTAEGPRAVLKIISVFLLVSVFWALFDQHASSWIRQAQQMDLRVNLAGWKFSLDPSQIAAANPFMIMLLIPLNNYLFFPLFENLGLRVTPLRKMSLGMFIASLAFVVVAIVQQWIDTRAVTGEKVSVLWQMLPYLIMTQAEVMISITGLEFAYTQAPKRMKSTIMGFWLLAISLGNILVAFVTKLPHMKNLPEWLQRFSQRLVFEEGSAGSALQQFFWLFAALMAAAAVIFSVRAMFYRYKDYTQ